MTLRFLNDVANDAKSKQKSKTTKTASLKCETMDTLINIITGLSL